MVLLVAVWVVMVIAGNCGTTGSLHLLEQAVVKAACVG